MVDYTSPIPFDEVRIRAAAVYCSDGRFSEQFDDLIQKHLQLPKYDRIALPGGPSCLASHFESYRDEEATLAQLEFLVAAHELEQVILITHQACAYYTEILKISPLKMEAQQREDLLKAVERVRRLDPDLEIDAFYARIVENHVAFEPVTG